MKPMKLPPFIINRPISYRIQYRLTPKQFHTSVKHAMFALCFIELLHFVSLGASLHFLCQNNNGTTLEEAAYHGTLFCSVSSFILLALQLTKFPTILKSLQQLPTVNQFLWRLALVRSGLAIFHFPLLVVVMMSIGKGSVVPYFVAHMSSFWTFLAAHGVFKLKKFINSYFDPSRIYLDDLNEEELDQYMRYRHEQRNKAPLVCIYLWMFPEERHYQSDIISA